MRSKETQAAITLANDRRGLWEPAQVRQLIAAADVILGNSGPHNDAEHKLIARAEALRIYEHTTPVQPSPFDARIAESETRHAAELAKRDQSLGALQDAVAQYRRGARNSAEATERLAAVEDARAEFIAQDEATARVKQGLRPLRPGASAGAGSSQYVSELHCGHQSRASGHPRL